MRYYTKEHGLYFSGRFYLCLGLLSGRRSLICGSLPCACLSHVFSFFSILFFIISLEVAQTSSASVMLRFVPYPRINAGSLCAMRRRSRTLSILHLMIPLATALSLTPFEDSVLWDPHPMSSSPRLHYHHWRTNISLTMSPLIDAVHPAMKTFIRGLYYSIMNHRTITNTLQIVVWASTKDESAARPRVASVTLIGTVEK